MLQCPADERVDQKIDQRLAKSHLPGQYLDIPHNLNPQSKAISTTINKVKSLHIKKVLHNSYAMCTHGSPDTYTPSPRGHTLGKPPMPMASYNTAVLHSRDRYEIIGLRKSSHSIKQPCNSICLKKAFVMHQSC